MPLRPRMVAPVGKSGPGMSVRSASRSSSRDASGCSRAHSDAAREFTQVVRRDAGGHADGDAFGAVGEQVREAGGQDGGFLVAAVVVVLEVDAFLVDVADHLHGQGSHLALGVTGGCGPRLPGVPKLPWPATRG